MSGAIVINGIMCPDNAANADAVLPAGSTFTVAPSMSVAVGSQILEFRSGTVYSLSPATVTLLESLGATCTPA